MAKGNAVKRLGAAADLLRGGYDGVPVGGTRVRTELTTTGPIEKTDAYIDSTTLKHTDTTTISQEIETIKQAEGITGPSGIIPSHVKLAPGTTLADGQAVSKTPGQDTWTPFDPSTGVDQTARNQATLTADENFYRAVAVTNSLLVSGSIAESTLSYDEATRVISTSDTNWSTDINSVYTNLVEGEGMFLIRVRLYGNGSFQIDDAVLVIEENSNGADGAKGDKGDTGERGATGDTGSQGDPGTAGARGNDGARGADGTAGSQGQRGERGIQGSQGSQGTRGAEGIQGTPGASIRGETGEQGETGARGAAGNDGSDGNPGVKGDKGDTGAVGPAGAGSTSSDVSDAVRHNTSRIGQLTEHQEAIEVKTDLDTVVKVHTDVDTVVKDLSEFPEVDDMSRGFTMAMTATDQWVDLGAMRTNAPSGLVNSSEAFGSTLQFYQQGQGRFSVEDARISNKDFNRIIPLCLQAFTAVSGTQDLLRVQGAALPILTQKAGEGISLNYKSGGATTSTAHNSPVHLTGSNTHWQAPFGTKSNAPISEEAFFDVPSDLPNQVITLVIILEVEGTAAVSLLHRFDFNRTTAQLFTTPQTFTYTTGSGQTETHALTFTSQYIRTGINAINEGKIRVKASLADPGFSYRLEAYHVDSTPILVPTRVIQTQVDFDGKSLLDSNELFDANLKNSLIVGQENGMGVILRPSTINLPDATDPFMQVSINYNGHKQTDNDWIETYVRASEYGLTRAVREWRLGATGMNTAGQMITYKDELHRATDNLARVAYDHRKIVGMGVFTRVTTDMVDTTVSKAATFNAPAYELKGVPINFIQGSLLEIIPPAVAREINSHANGLTFAELDFNNVDAHDEVELRIRAFVGGVFVDSDPIELPLTKDIRATIKTAALSVGTTIANNVTVQFGRIAHVIRSLTLVKDAHASRSGNLDLIVDNGDANAIPHLSATPASIIYLAFHNDALIISQSGGDGGSSTPGQTGATGPRGNPGADGAAGAKGDKGDTGTAGTNGSDGTQGNPGPRGFTGTTGDDGAVGQRGAAGNTGNPGSQGPRGADGNPGSNGTDGEDGTNGDPGTNGTNGTNGAMGNPGTNGSDGARGLTGATGPAGSSSIPIATDRLYRVVVSGTAVVKPTVTYNGSVFAASNWVGSIPAVPSGSVRYYIEVRAFTGNLVSVSDLTLEQLSFNNSNGQLTANGLVATIPYVTTV